MVSKAYKRKIKLKQNYEKKKLSQEEESESRETRSQDERRAKLREKYKKYYSKNFIQKQRKYRSRKNQVAVHYQQNRQRFQALYLKNREKIREQYQEKREKLRGKYLQNREKIRGRYQKNREKIREKNHENREAIRRKYHQNLVAIRGRYEKNKEKYLNKTREWKKNNPHSYKDQNARRYARMRSHYKELFQRRHSLLNEARKKAKAEKRKRRAEFRERTCHDVIMTPDNEPVVKNSEPMQKREKRDPFQIKGHKEKWTKDLMKKLKNKASISAKRLRAESLITWALKYRALEIKMYKANSIRLKSAFTKLMLNIRTNYDESVDLEAVLGTSAHSSLTENYFLDPIYNLLPQGRVYQITEKGVVMNLFPIMKDNKWKCSPQVCRLDKSAAIEKITSICKRVISTSNDKMRHFFKTFDLCSSDLPKSSVYQGHSIACHSSESCISQLLFLRTLAPHFPLIRTLVTSFYSTKRNFVNVDKINLAITAGHVDTLEQTEEKLRSKGQEFRFSTNMSFQHEDEIKSVYRRSFEAMTKRVQDIPVHTCMSCNKLMCRRDIVERARMKSLPVCPAWEELVQLIEDNNLPGLYVCLFCIGKFRAGKMPATCILNSLQPVTIPSEIAQLNDYEKLIIQRAKAFQTVIRMGSVSGRRQPHSNLLQKVVGCTTHLPLPTERTLRKLPDPTEAIVQDQELYVTVRGLPSKAKKIWQTNICIGKIHRALQWLKEHNKLYREIRLTSDEEALRPMLERLEEDVYVEEGQDDPNDDTSLGRGMLTQRDPNDAYYEQFTIHALHGERLNETSTKLYQMLRVEEQFIDSRHADLDLMCFPDLYPYGQNGLCEQRKEHLTAAEFVKCKLLSRNPQYRLNIQYIFYLYHESNIRALKAGIYHKLNIVNKNALTAGQCLKMLQTEELEGNLTTIFARLRNTAQFWMKPRSDVTTMITWYGPVTFFLTLSPSEYNWTDLDSYLREVNGHMTGRSTSSLIVKDPVSTCRFIDIKFKAMLDFLQADDGPLGRVVHYVWRREYQTRGMQHFHMLIWVEDAPIIGVNSNDEIAEFINKSITCRKPDDITFPTLAQKVQLYQMHYHNCYCMRTKKTSCGFIRACRFAFPRNLSDSLILRDVAQSIAGRRLLSKTRLYDLARAKGEECINDYNPAILLAWEGNMDIQFIGEKTCALSTYITKYETKAEKSNTVDLFDVMTSVKSLAQKLWNIGLKKLSSRECGVLEASDALLGISLFGTDRGTVIKWVDVAMTRSRKLKDKRAIENLDDSSEDIFCPSLVDTHYPNRPLHFEEVCLFEFVRNYDIVKSRPKSDGTVCVEYPGVGYIKKRVVPYLVKHQVYNIHTHPEDYFHSMLLLFKPWRKLEDLRGDKHDYASAFHDNEELIDIAIQHHDRLQYLRKSREEVDKAVQNIIAAKDGKETSITANHIADEAANAMEEMNVLNDVAVVDEAGIRDMISSLNSDQKRVFDHVSSTLSNETSTPLRHFVSGVGGTGKSYLIKTLKCWTRFSLDKMVALSAPTGVAAFNIEGITIHRLLQLPIEHGKIPEYKPLSDAVLKIIRENFRNVVLLVIDEISMVSNLTLLYIHFRLTEVFDSGNKDNGWFGGLHVLVFGDMLQLPPVMEEPPFKILDTRKMEKYVHSTSTFDVWKELFTYDELTINVRQSSDSEFADLLGRLRTGHVTESDIRLLNSRLVPLHSSRPDARLKELAKYVLELPEAPLVILPTREHCRALNQACLDLQSEEEIIIAAEDTFDGQQRLRAKATKKLQGFENDSSRTAGLESRLKIKLNSRVMLQKNLDLKAGLVNGSRGTVEGFHYNFEGNLESIKIRLTDKTVDLERIQGKFEVMPGAFIVRSQFPICISYAITIHKCQGISVPSCVLDVGQSIFAHGQTYVALSRVTSLAGLHIINFDPSKCKASKEAIEEYNRLRGRFCPHLPAISHCEVRLPQQSDRVWKTPKHAQDVQAENIPPLELICIPGFLNADGVSCYANAVLQCLLNCEPILQQILEDSSNNPLTRIARSFVSQSNTLDSRPLRISMGEPYSLPQQQDSNEFLEELLQIHPDMRDMFKFEQLNMIRCTQCPFERVEQELDIRSTLPLRLYGVASSTLKDLLKRNLEWNEISSSRCPNCSAPLEEKIEPGQFGQFLVMTLALWVTGTKVTNFKLTALPSTVLKLGTVRFVLKSAVFHHGMLLESGHYTAMIKSGSNFIRTNDTTVSKERWPNASKDIYMIILERK